MSPRQWERMLTALAIVFLTTRSWPARGSEPDRYALPKLWFSHDANGSQGAPLCGLLVCSLEPGGVCHDPAL